MSISLTRSSHHKSSSATLALLISLFSIALPSSAVARDNCIDIQASQKNKNELVMTNLCLEGRQLTITTPKKTRQLCLMPGESKRLGARPLKRGDTRLSDEGACEK